MYSADAVSMLLLEKKYVAINHSRDVLIQRWSVMDSVAGVLARYKMRDDKVKQLEHCLPQILELVICLIQQDDGLLCPCPDSWYNTNSRYLALSSVLSPLIEATSSSEDDGVWRTVPGNSPFSHLLHILPTSMYISLYYLLASSVVRPRRRSSHLRKYLATSPTYLPNVPPPSDDVDGDIAAVLASSRNSILTALQSQYQCHLDNERTIQMQVHKQQMLIGAIQSTVKKVSNELLHQRNFLVRDILRREIEAMPDLFPLRSPLANDVVLTELLYDEVGNLFSISLL